MVGLIRFAAKAAAAEAAAAESAAEIERLKAELLKIEGKKRRQTYPISVSSMAMKSSARAEFRRQQVADDPCPGGFVCHRMFIEFVKASHLMKNGTSESLMEVEKLENDMKDVEQELENYLGNLLSERRTKQSLFSDQYPDEETPQSAVAAEMFRFVLERLKQKQQSRKEESSKQPSIIVSHQFSVVSAVEEADIVRMQAEIDSRFNPLDRSSESQEVALEADTTRRTKTTMHIDILFWFVRPEEEVKMKKDMGTCCLAVVVYKANDNKVQYRKAQADMYASNIQVLHKKPCLSIDIGGGNNVTNWITSVYALATRPDGFPPDTEIHLWDKPLLYQGTGISTIVRVAAGLLACLPYYSTQLDDFGERLGPCVGLVGSKVFKAFDPATRKANIDVIRCFLDKDAILWKSADELVEIVEMAHLESNWHGELTAGVFVSILQKLSALHKKGFVHGDIRLFNLLSTGYILDFDYVGLDTYPKGLNLLPDEGVRHSQVAAAILNGSIGEMKPEKKHDCFSMSKVMELFQPKNNWWRNATNLVRKGHLSQAISLLQAHKDDQISLHITGPSSINADHTSESE